MCRPTGAGGGGGGCGGTHTCRTSSSTFFLGLGLRHQQHTGVAASGRQRRAQQTPATGVLPGSRTMWPRACPPGTTKSARQQTHGLRSLGLIIRFTSAYFLVFLALPIVLRRTSYWQA